MLFQELAANGANIRACIRCSTARGYCPAGGECREYPSGITITSLHDLAEMLRGSDKVISLSR
jgi:tRNA 2-thiouridine synthesizing protein D